MTTNTANTKTVWIHDGGTVACATHGGGYLAAAIKANPRKRIHRTPRGSWERDDTQQFPCEICHPRFLG